MKIFETVDINSYGPYDVMVPGESIYAIDARHAYIALKHHGRAKAIITDVQDVEFVDPKRTVAVDSLLMPSKLQLN